MVYNNTFSNYNEKNTKFLVSCINTTAMNSNERDNWPKLFIFNWLIYYIGSINTLTINEVKSLLGTKIGPNLNPSPKKTYKGEEIQVPESFDSRDKWVRRFCIIDIWLFCLVWM